LEIIIGVSIIVIGLLALLAAANFSLKVSGSASEKTKALNLAQEAAEAVRSFRDGTSWDDNGIGTLNTDIDYHPQLDSSTSPFSWDIVQGEEIINKFTRKVVFKKVSRDPDTGVIEEAYDSVYDDPDTRKVVIRVLWGGETLELSTYITNWRQ